MSFSSTTSSVFENSTSEEWLSDVIVSDPMNDYTCFLQTTNVPFTVRQNNTGIQSTYFICDIQTTFILNLYL